MMRLFAGFGGAAYNPDEPGKGKTMKSISITEAKKDLSYLAQSDQTFRLTNRGHEMATLRVFAQPKFDQDKARECFDKFKANRSAKPNARTGGMASIRALRDAN